MPKKDSPWKVKILPLPPRFTRGSANGFVEGRPVGAVEAARKPNEACWWPDGKPQLLHLEGQSTGAGWSSGKVIPGYRRIDSLSLVPFAWYFRGDKLEPVELPHEGLSTCRAVAAGAELILGAGRGEGTPSGRMRDVGMVWHEGGQSHMIAADGEVSLRCTDGIRFGGSVHGRAALWPSADSAHVDLTPKGVPMAQIVAFDGDLQFGTIWKKDTERAALWQGDASSFVDLTPEGHATGGVSGASRGYQVGYARVKDRTGNGSHGYDNRAILWQGSPQRWLDLQALLPAPYNASRAAAIEVSEQGLAICGVAAVIEVTNQGTPSEYHVQPKCHPVLWTCAGLPEL